MTQLTVFDEQGTVIEWTDDADTIAATLAGIAVRFARRDPDRPEALIEELRTAGYETIDTVSATPDHPDRTAMRARFLAEHRHAEDEVRFFTDGAGLFTLREAGRVYAVLCTAGDLISVPAGMRHWFDMGAVPRFTAVRFFRTADGWVGAFTGDTIADRFPRLEPA